MGVYAYVSGPGLVSSLVMFIDTWYFGSELNCISQYDVFLLSSP